MLLLMLWILLMTLILEWKVTEDARERGRRKRFLRSRKRVRRRVGRSRVRWLVHGRCLLSRSRPREVLSLFVRSVDYDMTLQARKVEVFVLYLMVDPTSYR